MRKRRAVAFRSDTWGGSLDATSMAFHVQPMAPADVAAVVGLQRRHLHGSILTQLGPGFLTRFHAVALTHDRSRAFVARGDAGDVLGFVLGSLDVHRFNAHLKPRVLVSMGLAVLAPARIRLVASLARMVVEGEPQPPMPAELLLLVVDPRARRSGIGRALLTALEAEFSRARIDRYRVAVRSQLAEARCFYEALAFEHEQDRVVLGHPMAYLTKRIIPTP